ncbi:hypothetical protein SAMN04488498_101606 [Mesorhizobium albiziae]|uniref:Protease inhibitor Inh n=2 Tax=Neomesorhizobium albiziae TaxID=335020 RepID=A0A1I3VNK7_9HYPH|nr:hypothetical protein GCM10007937_07690 [Mesorhizobium albiziae]SFJ96825.1 hypothetical protein SAMN04488498_101606 [Mesorhizobium albiziae]
MPMKAILLTLPLMLGGATQLMAASLDALQGAWTAEGTSCTDTFKTVNGHSEFKDRGASLNSGIIVSGKKITGANAVCTAGRVREEKDRLTISMTCADTIMFSDMSVSFRIIDKDSFERFDPNFSDVLTTYHRCSP